MRCPVTYWTTYYLKCPLVKAPDNVKAMGQELSEDGLAFSIFNRSLIKTSTSCSIYHEMLYSVYAF